jgi:hypothetical protein
MIPFADMILTVTAGPASLVPEILGNQWGYPEISADTTKKRLESLYYTFSVSSDYIDDSDKERYADERQLTPSQST